MDEEEGNKGLEAKLQVEKAKVCMTAYVKCTSIAKISLFWNEEQKKKRR